MLDLKRDESGDVAIANDDLAIATSDEHHRADLIMLEKGALKQSITAGVGAAMFLEGEDEAGLLREISLQFSADGMKVKKVGLQNGKILIDAPYL